MKPWVLERYAVSEEIAARLGIDNDRLGELVDAGFIPHVVYEGDVYFPRGAVKAWARDNLEQVHEGMPIPRDLPVYTTNGKDMGRVPFAICQLDGLQRVPTVGRMPGVYFLCRDDEVVYVGQSVHVPLRVGEHVRQGEKEFDRAFYVSCLQSELTRLEGQFIKSLKPIYNQR